MVAAVAVATPASAATQWTVDRKDPGSSAASFEFLSGTVSGGDEMWAATGSGTKDLVMRKRGSTWQQIPAPAGMSGKNAWFTGLDAVAPDNVWLQARTADVSGFQYYHYDGSDWSKISSAGSGNGKYTGIAASSSTAWAAASLTEVARYTDGKWTPMAVPEAAHISGIAAAARDDVWVVGGDSAGKALAAHYDGTEWTRTTFPSDSCGLGVSDVTTVSKDNAYAYCNVSSDGTRSVTAMHWDGKAWSTVGEPFRGKQDTGDMTASPDGDVWVTASDKVLHLSGDTWTLEDVNDGSLPYTYVADVAVFPGTGTPYATGYQYDEEDDQVVALDYLVWKRAS